VAEKCPRILPKMPTWKSGFLDGVLRIFFRPKNPTSSAGCEPSNLVTKGQHAASKPPKQAVSHLKVVCEWHCLLTVYVDCN